MKSGICGRCGEEVRLGYRPSPVAPAGGVPVDYWMHRDVETDLDHRPAFGRVMTEEDYAEIERQRNQTWAEPVKVGSKWAWSMAEYEHLKMKKAAREAAGLEEEDDDAPDPQEVPEPEVRSTPIEIGDERLPGGAKQIINLARKYGWEAWATYSRGPRMHASWGTLIGICDFVVVRMRLDGSDRRAVGSWKNGKFEFAWTATVTRDSKTHPHKANSDELKAWIRGE